MAPPRPSCLGFAIAASCRLPYCATVVRHEPGGEQVWFWPLRFGAQAVRLPERPETALTRVLVEGPWAHAVGVAGDAEADRSRCSLWHLVERAYLARRRVEEAIRFVKQS